MEEKKQLTPEEKVKELKKVIRLTYKSFFWMSIFLLLPTITKYIIKWSMFQYTIDVGIVLLTFSLWRINKKMEKKRKEDEE